MAVEYDTYYQTRNLFGAAYPELLSYFASLQIKGKLLDLGCGQGRDSVPLAKMGYDVTGVDHSKVGISQMNEIAKREKLPLIGIVADIYAYSGFDNFDFILLDSMFHFGKKERDEETLLLEKILDMAKKDASIIICIQNSGKKVDILDGIIKGKKDIGVIFREHLVYVFEDKESSHRSETKYLMLVLRKNA